MASCSKTFSVASAAAALLALAGQALALPTEVPPSVKRDINAIASSYDYIIVGGGTSGLVVANRLTANSAISVLVVEYGDFDDTWNTALPFYATTDQTPILYNYTTTAQTGLGGRTFKYNAGAVVGGGSTVNGMAFDRGSQADYDAWSELGNTGWGYSDLLPYFKKATTFTAPAATYESKYGFEWTASAYGTDGPIQVGFPSWQWPDYVTEQASWEKDLNTPYIVDGAAGTNVGLAWIPENIDPVNATRSNARTNYYNPIKNRSNLNLLVKSYASSITFSGTTATGVKIVSRSSGATTTVTATREVIIAAGAFNTPRLLQLSGVGPGNVLKAAGVPVVADLPGVGSNLQDHPYFLFIYNFATPSSDNPNILTVGSQFYNDSWVEYQNSRTGPLTEAHGNQIVFRSLQDLTSNYSAIASSLDSQTATSYLPAQYASNATLLAGFLAQRKVLQDRLTRTDAGVAEYPLSGGAVQPVAVEKSFSRGQVSINSGTTSDPTNSPIIDFQAMVNPVDMAIAVAAFKVGRASMSGASMQSLGPTELVPGTAVSSDAQIENTLRASSLNPGFSHPCGTAALLPFASGGVVDTNLRVYNTSKLRVIDASIIPLIPATHLQWTVYAIAEKAADLIIAAQ